MPKLVQMGPYADPEQHAKSSGVCNRGQLGLHMDSIDVCRHPNNNLNYLLTVYSKDCCA